tara:strand:- start:87 stop:608 length:522 start_codon:yes stop_codon:yes gene_type:complete
VSDNLYSFYTGKKYNKNTILDDGKGQIAGRMGEAEFAKLLCFYAPSFIWLGSNAGHYDFIIKITDERAFSVDVKTKSRNVPVKNWYSAHVTMSQRTYDVDVYVFANETDGEVSMMGWCTKEWFWHNARIVQAGDADEKDDGFVERDAAGKVPYNSLRPMEEMWERLLAYSRAE